MRSLSPKVQTLDTFTVNCIISEPIISKFWGKARGIAITHYYFTQPPSSWEREREHKRSWNREKERAREKKRKKEGEREIEGRRRGKEGEREGTWQYLIMSLLYYSYRSDDRLLRCKSLSSLSKAFTPIANTAELRGKFALIMNIKSTFSKSWILLPYIPTRDFQDKT